MSNKTDKKPNIDWGKKWRESNVVFLPKDKLDEKTYLHEYLGISMKKV